MNKSIVEFRIKAAGVSWEDAPVKHSNAYIDQPAADCTAQQMANQYQAEVRWNWQGLGQGHYVIPTMVIA